MKRKLDYRWHLRELAAAKGMFSTTVLVPLLAERGVELSSVQVYRLVTQIPERLSLRTLTALCDILDCTPTDLIETVVEETPASKRKVAGAKGGSRNMRPKPARVSPPKR